MINYARDVDGAAAVVAGIEQEGGMAIAIRADIPVSDEVVRLFEEVDDRFGPPAVLVNNAGIVGGQMPISEIDEAMLSQVLATNVSGSIFLHA